jgi:hypothetical protein
MIIKKLAVPLINDKILQQVEHCYIATTAISEAGFEFIRSRLPLKCKIDIVTGLDGLTSPTVLKRIWRHYQDRMTLKIYTRNFFHANAYIFDLPFKKSVAFLGSGYLTLGGLKDDEELFYKITDAKEIEALMSWYTGYYEFSETLSENIVRAYEEIYPLLHQHQIAAREEKERALALTTRGFNWETIRFKNQYFKKEDYSIFSNSSASLVTAEVNTQRQAVRDKLQHLHEQIGNHINKLGLYENPDGDCISNLDPLRYPDQRLRLLSISYGRGTKERARYNGETLGDFITLQIIIQSREVGVWLTGDAKTGRHDREYVRQKMNDADYVKVFFNFVRALGPQYRIEIAGEKKAADSFQNEEALREFMNTDDWRYFKFAIGRNYIAGDAELNTDTISKTIVSDADRLMPIYEHIKDKPT